MTSWVKSSRSGLNGCVEVAFHKSSRSGENGCVEVAVEPPVVLVRNSRDPDGPRLSFSMDEWRVFIAGVRNDEFDLPEKVT